MRQHQLRPVDFRKGERLGKDDHKVVLKRPEQRPKWMSEEQYERMPEELEVREVKVRVAVKGFRVRTLVIVTTLLDAELYPKQEIARAFRCRWHVEMCHPYCLHCNRVYLPQVPDTPGLGLGLVRSAA
jgi:hypothetical protein